MKNNLFKIFIFLVSIFLFVCDFNINPTISKNIVEIDIDLPFVEIREDEEEKYINVKNSDIYKNDHYRFNLLIDNTSFKEPIYQYSDNDYYLTHNGLGKKQKSGATYMDYRVSVNSKKILIYGHNNDKLSLLLCATSTVFQTYDVTIIVLTVFAKIGEILSNFINISLKIVCNCIQVNFTSLNEHTKRIVNRVQEVSKRNFKNLLFLFIFQNIVYGRYLDNHSVLESTKVQNVIFNISKWQKVLEKTCQFLSKTFRLYGVG